MKKRNNENILNFTAILIVILLILPCFAYAINCDRMPQPPIPPTEPAKPLSPYKPRELDAYKQAYSRYLKLVIKYQESYNKYLKRLEQWNEKCHKIKRERIAQTESLIVPMPSGLHDYDIYYNNMMKYYLELNQYNSKVGD